MTCQIWLRGVAGLATTLARTLGCISSDLTDLWVFVFLTWSQTCSLFTVREISLPRYPLRRSWAGEKWEAWSGLMKSVKTEVNPSLLHIHCHQFCLHVYWDCIFSLAFLSWPTPLAESSLGVLHISCEVPLYLCLSFCYPIPTYLNHIPLPFQVPAFTGCAFLSYSSVFLCTLQVSSLCCLISWTSGWRVFVL